MQTFAKFVSPVHPTPLPTKDGHRSGFNKLLATGFHSASLPIFIMNNERRSVSASEFYWIKFCNNFCNNYKNFTILKCNLILLISLAHLRYNNRYYAKFSIRRTLCMYIRSKTWPLFIGTSVYDSARDKYHEWIPRGNQWEMKFTWRVTIAT